MNNLYTNKIIYFGVSNEVAESVHTTSVKQQILEHFPSLVETKDGNSILLTLDREMGRALIEACKSTCLDDGIILAKAANIIRRELFLRDELFDGDISRTKQTDSVPLTLINLISLILEGGIPEIQSKNSMKIATNFSQLIRFISVKSKRKETVTQLRH